MTRALFNIGQTIICVKGGHWTADHSLERAGATKGKLYTVTDMEYRACWDDWYLQLAECPADAVYLQGHFAAVEMASDAALAALLTDALSSVCNC
jgi:hypothetical protein